MSTSLGPRSTTEPSTTTSISVPSIEIFTRRNKRRCLDVQKFSDFRNCLSTQLIIIFYGRQVQSGPVGYLVSRSSLQTFLTQFQTLRQTQPD